MLEEHIASWRNPFFEESKNYKKQKEKKFAPVKTHKDLLKTWCYLRKKGHGPVLLPRKKEMISWLCNNSQLPRKTSQEEAKGETVLQKNTSWTPEKWTKEDQLELFSDFSFNDRWFCLLVVVLLFNFKERNRTVWPKGFSLRKNAWEHFLLDHISWKCPLMFLTKPKKLLNPSHDTIAKWGTKSKTKKGRYAPRKSLTKAQEELLRRWKKDRLSTKNYKKYTYTKTKNKLKDQNKNK